MNKYHLLDIILEQTENKATETYNEFTGDLNDLNLSLRSINQRKDIALPEVLPSDERELVRFLRNLFKDSVSLVTFVLHWKLPDKYFFYRVSKLEPDIFAGLEFFQDAIPSFDLGFQNIGTGSGCFERYLRFNEMMRTFLQDIWTDEKDIAVLQKRFSYFLYDILAKLFLEKDVIRRFWIMATDPEFWKEIDGLKDEEVAYWSGRKEMQDGDLIFLYRTSPCSAITDLFVVRGDPWFDPVESWHGLQVEIAPLAQIPDITFKTMMNDPMLGKWGLVKRRFIGTTAEPVPHAFYNRLIEMIPKDICEGVGLEPEQLSSTRESGRYSSEEDFEKDYLIPLFKRWGFRHDYQYPCVVYAGRQKHVCRIDFLVRDGKGPVTVFEDKLKITDDDELDEAMLQARSYALHLGLNSFVVASPEGLWIYTLRRNKENLAEEVPLDQLEKNYEAIRDLILKLR